MDVFNITNEYVSKNNTIQTTDSENDIIGIILPTLVFSIPGRILLSLPSFHNLDND